MKRVAPLLVLAGYVALGGVLLVLDTLNPDIDSQSVLLWFAGGLAGASAWFALRSLQAANRQVKIAGDQVIALNQQLDLTREQLKPQMGLLTGFDFGDGRWVVAVRNRGPGRAVELRIRGGIEADLSTQAVVSELPAIPTAVSLSAWHDADALLRPQTDMRLMIGPVSRGTLEARVPIAIGEASDARPLFDATTTSIGPVASPVGWTIFLEVAAQSLLGDEIRYAFFLRQPPPGTTVPGPLHGDARET